MAHDGISTAQTCADEAASYGNARRNALKSTPLETDSAMTVRNLDSIFRARTVALFGASPRPGTVGSVIRQNLLADGDAHRTLLVNPGHTEIDGVVC